MSFPVHNLLKPVGGGLYI